MRRIAIIAAAAAVLLAGCGSAPTGSTFRRKYSAAKKELAAAREAKKSDEFDKAVTMLEDIEAATTKMLVKMPPGDRYMEKTEKLLDEALRLRDDIKAERGKGSGKNASLIAAALRRAPSEAKFFGEEEIDGDSKMDPAEAARKRAKTDRTSREAARLAAEKADMEARRAGTVARSKATARENLEEVEAAEKIARNVRKFEDKLAKPKRPKGKVTAESKPLTRVKVCIKGEFIVAYVLFVNNTETVFRIGSVTGEFLDDNGNYVERTAMAYVSKGFKPNWENIFESEGTVITAESLELQPKKKVMVAVIGQGRAAGRVKKVRLTVPVTTGELYQGPD